MFCNSILLPYVKNSIYNIADNNSNSSSNNSESDTELPDFSTSKPFDMEPRKKVIKKYIKSYKKVIKDIHSTNVNPRTF